jgi:hypothetical protein
MDSLSRYALMMADAQKLVTLKCMHVLCQTVFSNIIQRTTYSGHLKPQVFWMKDTVLQVCTDSGHQVTVATKFVWRCQTFQVH